MADIPQRPEDLEPVTMHIDGTDYETRLTRKVRERPPWKPVDKTVVTTAIPGLIQEILVREGQRIRRDQGVVVLEAMKMSNEVQSPWEGTVASIEVDVGQNVPKGTVLIRLV
ncbi:acetyl-CoA carboxylase biotin carboxyl carrier protein subunit [bacterium]|nr:acetyl-CoA carboxylase biotin carboxyl carrier protein subunit [bacterium]